MGKNSKPDKLTQTIIRTINEEKPQNVEQLINLVKEKTSISEEKILDAVLKLQSQGKIRFEKKPPPTSPKLSTYMKTSQALWYWVTIAIATITVAVIFTLPENMYPLTYVRNVLGAIFVLWLPGYTLIKTLFPKEVPIPLRSKELDNIERIALSVGMSIALVPMVGLILNYTPWGIRLTPIVLSLFALMLIFATAAVVREFQNQKQA